MRIKYAFLVMLWAYLNAFVAQAQDASTAYFMHTSTFRHHMNPAFLERNSYIGVPFLSNINAGLGINMGTGAFIYQINPATNKGKHYGTFLHPEVSAQQFYDKIGNNPLRAKLHLNYSIFSVSAKNTLVELNMRAFADAMLPNDYLRFLKKIGGQDVYNFTNWGFRHYTYAELVFGRAVRFNKQFSIGVKAKALVGLSYADWDVEHLRVVTNDEHLRVSGYANAALAVMKNRIPLDSAGRFIGEAHDPQPGITGWGLGFDLGATYKFRNLDNLTLSAALTDIGFINHNSATNFETLKGEWKFDGFEQAYMGSDKEKSQHIDDEINQLGKDWKQFMSVYSTDKKGKTQSLAATLNLGAEYALPVYNKMSFGALFSHRFNGKYSWTKAMLSTRVRPLKWLELGLSASASTYSTSSGAMLSLYAPGFNFYFGSDELFVQMSKQYLPIYGSSPNVNLGFVFPL